MKKLLITAVLGLSIATPSFADLYQISATGTSQDMPGGGLVTTFNWALVYDDVSNDGLLQIDEIVSFTGTAVRVTGSTPAIYVYDGIVGSPAISGISTLSGGLDDCCWWFTGSRLATPPQDGWFPSRWTYEQKKLLLACENPVTLNEVSNNVTTGFTVDPTLPQPPIIDAAQGQNVRGFLDVERGDVISVQCESDYFATYVWFGAGSAADTAAERIAKVEAFVANVVGEISVFVDEIPVESFVTPAVDGFRPNSTRNPSGMIVAGYIVKPFELSPGVHRVRMEFGNFGVFADIPFVVVAATPTPDILLEQLGTAVIGVGPGNSLADKIMLAQTYLAVPDVQSTCAILNDFQNQVRAQTGKKLTIETADQLTADAEAIRVAIGCD